MTNSRVSRWEAGLAEPSNPATTKIYAKWDLRYGVDVVSQMKVPGAWN